MVAKDLFKKLLASHLEISSRLMDVVAGCVMSLMLSILRLLRRLSAIKIKLNIPDRGLAMGIWRKTRFRIWDQNWASPSKTGKAAICRGSSSNSDVE